MLSPSSSWDIWFFLGRYLACAWKKRVLAPPSRMKAHCRAAGRLPALLRARNDEHGQSAYHQPNPECCGLLCVVRNPVGDTGQRLESLSATPTPWIEQNQDFTHSSSFMSRLSLWECARMQTRSLERSRGWEYMIRWKRNKAHQKCCHFLLLLYWLLYMFSTMIFSNLWNLMQGI